MSTLNLRVKRRAHDAHNQQAPRSTAQNKNVSCELHKINIMNNITIDASTGNIVVKSMIKYILHEGQF